MSRSRISRIPIWLRSLAPSEVSAESGESNREELYRSTDARLLGVGLLAGGLLVYDPLASLTVFTADSSDDVLLSILAAASELEKRGGKMGRAFDGVLEKNRGDGGLVVLIDGPENAKFWSLCIGLLSNLGFLKVGDLAGRVAKSSVAVIGRFRIETVSGVVTGRAVS